MAGARPQLATSSTWPQKAGGPRFRQPPHDGAEQQQARPWRWRTSPPERAAPPRRKRRPVPANRRSRPAAAYCRAPWERTARPADRRPNARLRQAQPAEIVLKKPAGEARASKTPAAAAAARRARRSGASGGQPSGWLGPRPAVTARTSSPRSRSIRVMFASSRRDIFLDAASSGHWTWPRNSPIDRAKLPSASLSFIRFVSTRATRTSEASTC